VKTATPAKTTKAAKVAKPATTRRPAAKASKRNALLPDLTRDALGEVTETLEFMWSATQAVFGDKAKPEHAIALLPYALDALEVRRLLAEETAKQPSSKR
jgi:hypothetical protein